jgi:hypothetical protein
MRLCAAPINSKPKQNARRGFDQAKQARHAMKERYKMNYKSRIPATIMAVLTRTVTRRGFLICALICVCSLAIVASARKATGDQPIPVAVLDTFSISQATPPTGFDVSFEGVVTAIIGTDVVTGTSRMDVKFVTGDIVHCKFTWVSSDGNGTLVLASVCVLSQGHGTWHVVKGTGRYKNFKAVGTETFGPLPTGSAFTDFERFAGVGTFDKHDDDEHGDDEHGGNQ